MVPPKPSTAKKPASRLRKLALLVPFLLIGGCSGGYFDKMLSSEFYRFYRMDISQGNLLDAATVARIKPGLTRQQVVYLLGQPVLPSMFHDERWDYIYYLDSLQEEKQEYFRLTLFFDGERIARVHQPRHGRPTPPGASTQEASPDDD